MKRSTDRILTTIVGSLVRPPAITEIMRLKESGQDYDKQEFAKRVTNEVTAVVKHEAQVGVDIPSDGEYSKSSFSGYVNDRLSGFEPRKTGPVAGRSPGRGRDRERFAAFYEELDREERASQGSPITGATATAAAGPLTCVGPINYTGSDILKTDLANFKKALEGVSVEEAFIPACAPGTIELQRQNEYYKTEEEFLFAIADAMREEYRAIVDAGFVLQIDDPRVVAQYDLNQPALSVEEYRKFAQIRIDAINHALEGLPEDRIRYHLCWGSWHGPHSTDIELKHIIDMVLGVHAQAISIEGANGRHAHEWKVWEHTKLPVGKILIPGVISHNTNSVEHPELVSERIVRLAKLVGRENVIGSTDCGFAQGAFTRRVHPTIMWAKLESLAQGAALATKELWG